MTEHACGKKQKNPRVDYPGDVGENELDTSLDPDSFGPGLFFLNRGPVAQLGARFHGMEEVVGSIPTRSTNFRFLSRRQSRISTLCVAMPLPGNKQVNRFLLSA
jgi:hypothetical protein